MLEWLLIGVAGIVVVSLTSAFAPRLGIAGPLILVTVGVLAALLPFFPDIEVDPEVILVGVLPPLLYAASVRLPAIEFRRDLRPIAGLAVLLVVVSALILGTFFFFVIPGIPFAAAVALGAILSPTDAVATSIAKRLGLSDRVVTLLEGESLLNDATSLVLLRTAIAAIAGGFALTEAVWDFVWGVFIAAIVGAIVGWLATRLRVIIGDSAAATAISFTVPYLAYLPSDALGGSGLVAAVVAGLVTGQERARWFTPEMRISDQLNWRTIELLFEGGVFLLMGLELLEVLEANIENSGGVWHATWLALSSFAIILAVRIVYVSYMVWAQGRRARRLSRESLEARRDRIEDYAARASGDHARRVHEHYHRHPDPARDARHAEVADKIRRRRIAAMRHSVRRALNDLDYYQASPLGWRHGTVIVWAGMRGVVTIAAVQTLPSDVANRELLVLIAFIVAAMSLMLQGYTLPWLLRALKIADEDAETTSLDEHRRLDTQLAAAAARTLDDPALRDEGGAPYDERVLAGARAKLRAPDDDDATAASQAALRLRMRLNHAMRERLALLSYGGEYSTSALRHALAELDAEQMSIQLRLDGVD